MGCWPPGPRGTSSADGTPERRSAPSCLQTPRSGRRQTLLAQCLGWLQARPRALEAQRCSTGVLPAPSRGPPAAVAGVWAAAEPSEGASRPGDVPGDPSAAFPYSLWVLRGSFAAVSHDGKCVEPSGVDPFWPPRPGGRNTSRAAAGWGWGSGRALAQVELERPVVLLGGKCGGGLKGPVV